MIVSDRALPGWAGRSEPCQQGGCDELRRRECTAGFAASCRALAAHEVPDENALLARTVEPARAGGRADIAPDCELIGELRETDDDLHPAQRVARLLRRRGAIDQPVTGGQAYSATRWAPWSTASRNLARPST